MVAPGEAVEHLQKLVCHALPPAGGIHRHIGDIALVGHHQQSGVAHRLLRLRLYRHQKGGALVVQLLRQHFFRPRTGKAHPLQLLQPVQMLRRHGYDLYLFHILLLCRQPVFAAVRLGDQRDGQAGGLLHLLRQQALYLLPLRRRALHD